jgi:NADP-dependent aldehyde dehydrogenase
MPDGVFSNLNAMDFQVGQQLVEHEGVAAVGFTGSIKGGVALLKLAASRKNPIPVFAEMGSVNPILLFPTKASDIKLWASKIVLSITNNSGQFCTKPGLIFCLKSPTSEDFFSTLNQQFSSVNSDYMVSPIICSNYNLRIEELKKYNEIEFHEGISHAIPNTGRPVLARIDGKEFVKHPSLQQEVFGPFSMVVFFDSMDDLVNAYSALDGQLTTSFFGGNDNDLAHEKLVFLASQKAGRIIFDEVPTGVEITSAMHHSGAFPASSDIRFTAVGVNSIDRFSRPIVYQNKQ